MSKVAIVMPAYNEEFGISIFLKELYDSFSDSEVEFIVVNDCSKDETELVVLTLKQTGFPVAIFTNTKNSGHGYSTLEALKFGLSTDAEAIIAIDGDGQFNGADVRKVFDSLSEEFEIVEGVRTQRNDPIFRKLTSMATRFLVFSRSRIWPKDANTPLRAYRRKTLEQILKMVPADTPIPNLYISAYARKNNIQYFELNVESRSRIGEEVIGTTWGKGLSWLPTRRFLKFIVAATTSWYKKKINNE